MRRGNIAAIKALPVGRDELPHKLPTGTPVTAKKGKDWLNANVVGLTYDAAKKVTGVKLLSTVDDQFDREAAYVVPYEKIGTNVLMNHCDLDHVLKQAQV